MRPEQARSPRRRIRDLSVIYANETQGWSVAELTWLRGPRGEKRPADVIGNAVKVMRIATVEETEELETDRAKSAAAVLGSRGGKARAERMSPERRHQIAKKAAAKRWSKYNFIRIHKTLRMSPAMAAGIETRLWSMDDVVRLIEAREDLRSGALLVDSG